MRPDPLLPLGMLSCMAGSDLRAMVCCFKYTGFGSKPVIKSKNGLFQLRGFKEIPGLMVYFWAFQNTPDHVGLLAG